jgi:hypothetical protein
MHIQFVVIILLATAIEQIHSLPVDHKIIKFADIKTMPRSILDEHIPTLSAEMVIHQYQYKPRGFNIEARRLSEKKVLIEFNYTSSEPYKKYAIRMRYHTHHIEYMTNKSLITVHEPNRVVLKNFPPAAYVLCVTLFPSIFASNMQVYPISSSDMCVDVVFGEEQSFSHNKTGLLSPLLLVLSFINLFAITMINKLNSAKHSDEKPANDSDTQSTVADKTKKDLSLERFNYLMNFNKEYNEARQLARMFSCYDENSEELVERRMYYVFEDTSSLSNNADSVKNLSDFDSSGDDKKKKDVKFQLK